MSRYLWLLLIPLGILTYHNLHKAGFVGDDYDQVLYNQVIRDLSQPQKFFTGSTFNSGGAEELRGTYYKPAMTAVFALIYAGFGASAFWFHVILFSLGILNAVLLFAFLRTLFPPAVSFVGAAFFLVHPGHSEVLQYISNYQDALFMTFGLAALNVEARRGPGLLTIVLLMLAALSKETGLLFIPLLGAYAWLILGKKRFDIMGLVVAGYVYLRVFVSNIHTVQANYTPMETASFGERMLNVPAAVHYYLKNFFVPWPLGLAQHWIYRELTVEGFVIPLFAIITALWFAYLSIQKFGRPAWFFTVWSVISVGLHSQLMVLDATVADRWLYLPSVGFLGLILLWLNEAWPRRARWFAAGAAIYIAVFAAWTFRRNSHWENEQMLLIRDLQYHDSFALMSQLGYLQLNLNRPDEACPLLKRSVELAPNWWINTNNYGVCLYMKGDVAGAKEQFARSMENGAYHLAFENYAKLLLAQGLKSEARAFIAEALRRLPGNQVLPGLLNDASKGP